MKKIATGAVFAALVTATVSPALAATNRPTPTVVDASVLASTIPATFAASSTDSVSQATTSTVSDPTLYSGLLSYFKADLNYQGAVYQAFVDAGLSTTALSQAYSKLDAATSSLIAYLQTTVTSA